MEPARVSGISRMTGDLIISCHMAKKRKEIGLNGLLRWCSDLRPIRS